MAHGISQEKMDEIGLDSEQVNVLKKCFDGFCVDGAIHVDTIGTILVSAKALWIMSMIDLTSVGTKLEMKPSIVGEWQRFWMNL